MRNLLVQLPALRTLSGVLASAALVALPSAAVGAWATAPEPVPAAVRVDDTELEKHMSAINKINRALRIELRDKENNAESLKKIQEMQEHALAAKVLTPQQIKEVPEEGHPAFLLEYRKEMILFLRGILDMEDALLAGDNDKAQDALKELNKQKSRTHKVYKIKD